MDREIKEQLEALRELKLYYDEAVKSGNADIASKIKINMLEHQKKLNSLKKRKERLDLIEQEKAAFTKGTIADNKQEIDEKSQKVKELEAILRQEKIKEQKERELEKALKLKEEQQRKEKEKKVDEIRKVANLKELKFGTLALFIGTLFLLIFTLLSPMPYAINTDLNVVQYESVPVYNLIYAYMVVLGIALLVFTYVQTNLKRMGLFRIYIIITMLVTSLCFDSFKFIHPKSKPFILQQGNGFAIIALILLIILLIILGKLLVRDKLAFQYVKKVEDN